MEAGPVRRDWRLPFDPLRAFCRDNHVALEPTGRGLLDNLTFAVKDVMEIAGHRSTFGQPTWYQTHGPAQHSAVAVRRLLAAGARMTGVTVTDELSYSLSGENIHYGAPVNPRCPGRVAGGSSSGSAAAVAGGLVDLALGTDCAGSVRLPASYCGVLGVRPTHGRVPADGVYPFAPAFDAVGWFARSPDVLERVGRVLLGDSSNPDPPRRLIIAKDAFELVQPRVTEALAGPLKTLRRHFAESDEVTVSLDGLAGWMDCFRTIQAYEIWSNLGRWVAEEKPNFGPGIQERFELASKVSRQDYEGALHVRHSIVARLEAIIRPGDVLCLPTSPRIAPLKGTPTDTMENTYRYQAMCLLCIAGHGGLPQITLPIASLDDCPLGLSILGPRGSDIQLLGLSRRIFDDQH